MAVEVMGERMGIQISWDPSGSPEEPPEGEKPPGVPTHPIVLPGDEPHPEHPIFLPPYVDNSLPGDQPGIWGPTDPRPDQGLPETPEEPEGPPGGIGPPGNLPPAAQPIVAHDENIACQVFAQGAEEEDWSNLPVQKNTGKALISYPKGFSGESWIEVRALDGSLIDSGTIEVG